MITALWRPWRYLMNRSGIAIIGDGNNREGVVRLDNFFANVRPSPLYMKYQFVEGNSATIWDDQLQVDYFSTLTAARGAFSAKKLTYVRMYERND